MNTLEDFVLDMIDMLETSNLPEDKDHYIDEEDFERLEHLQEAASDLFTKDDYTPDFERMDEWHKEHGILIVPENSPQMYSYVVSMSTKKGWVSFMIPYAPTYDRGT